MVPVRLLIADDHAIVRQGLRALLQEQPGWQIAAEAKDGREAVAKARELKPDVAILDVSMPSLNGFDATKQVIKVSPNTKILILTVHDSEQVIQKVLTAGARGYILNASRDLVAAVNALLAKKTFFTAKAAQLVLDRYLGKASKVTEDEAALTGREREIVQLLAEGKSSKEVATELTLSVKTVETHRTNILRKLNLHSVTQLVRYAVRNYLTEA